MRARCVIAIVGLTGLVGLVGCGGEASDVVGDTTPIEDGVEAPPATSGSDPGVLTGPQARVEQLLLARDDLPDGYSTYREPVDDFAYTCGAPGVAPLGEGVRAYKTGPYGPIVTEWAGVYASPDEAAQAFGEYSTIIAGCGSFDLVDDTGGVVGVTRVSPIDYDPLGDESAAASILQEWSGGLIPNAGAVVVFRRGDVVAIVSGLYLGGDATEGLRGIAALADEILATRGLASEPT